MTEKQSTEEVIYELLNLMGCLGLQMPKDSNYEFWKELYQLKGDLDE